MKANALDIDIALSRARKTTANASGYESTVPLIVDLDGTLIRSDLLVESAFAYLGTDPRRAWQMAKSLKTGKAALKSEIADKTAVDPAHLPYDDNVLALIREAKAAGREVFLASASNERYVRAVADHLDLFDGWFASDDDRNLSSAAKAELLVSNFEEHGFDYIGNSRDDLAIWTVARKRIAVQPSSSVRKALWKLDPNAKVLEQSTGGLRTWLKLLRVHQWAKNALVFIPLMTAHRFDLISVAHALAAFLAFSLAASSVYIFNDIVDLESDRKHPTKKRRPLAAGTVPILQAVMLAPVIAAVALGIAFTTSLSFALVLLGYLALTTAYTFVLKRKMIVDVVALAALYTIRVIGGAEAIAVPISEWLLGFSMFIFASLALIKRYIELAAREDAGLPDPSNRNYRKSDLGIVAALAAAAGFNAVTVFALYVSSDSVRQIYSQPKWLWLICPILMYWLGRALMMAHRRLMDDDPVVFALRDINSLVAAGLIGAIMIAAI
jgi:4-hydroxybenzoate polyprenyltransferase/phosphoserine phosphatase